MSNIKSKLVIVSTMLQIVTVVATNILQIKSVSAQNIDVEQ